MSSPVSIITTSYNQLKTLKFLFTTLERQTYSGFEVIVADDGSSDGSREFCEIPTSFPKLFVTQNDDGFRKSRILNEAVSKASGDYLIFLDSDVLLEKHFVEDHVRLRTQGSFVCGRRVDLGPRISSKITSAQIGLGWYDRLRLETVLSGLMGDSSNIKRGIRIKTPLFRKCLGYTKPIDILGSNVSLWKSDLLAVNGFNEALESYWGEDGDLFIRLRNSGKTSISAKGLCIQYHVFHARREPTAENQMQINELLKNTEYKWVENGYRLRFKE